MNNRHPQSQQPEHNWSLISNQIGAKSYRKRDRLGVTAEARAGRHRGEGRGSRQPGSRDGNWPEKIAARIPAELAVRAQAACWHTSATAIQALRDLRDEYAPGVAANPGRLPGYRHLAESVTTPGVIWRAALDRVLPPG